MEQTPLAYLKEAAEILDTFMSSRASMEAIDKAISVLATSLEGGGKAMSCGNGGSMSDAMHFAEELTGRFRNNRPSLAGIAISDPAYLTCVANDYGYESVFSRFVEGMGEKGDVLLAISTSGNSANVLKAAQTARASGISVIGLTGKDGGELAAHSDVEIRAPFSKYADHVQEIHIKVIHCLIAGVESALGHG